MARRTAIIPIPKGLEKRWLTPRPGSLAAKILAQDAEGARGTVDIVPKKFPAQDAEGDNIKRWITANSTPIPVKGKQSGKEAVRSFAEENRENTAETGAQITQFSPLEYTKMLSKYIDECGGDHYKGAIKFYKNHLNKKSVTCRTDNGTIEACFTGNGLKKLQYGMKFDLVKAEIFPYLPDILTTGEYERFEAFKERRDGTVCFHTFRKKVPTSEGMKMVIVDVAERPGQIPPYTVYNMTREGAKNYIARLEGEQEARQQKKSASSRNGDNPVSKKRSNGNAVTKDSIAPLYEVVNIRIRKSA